MQRPTFLRYLCALRFSFIGKNYCIFTQAVHFLKTNEFWMTSRIAINFLYFWHRPHTNSLQIPLLLKAYFWSHCFHNKYDDSFEDLYLSSAKMYLPKARMESSTSDCTTKHCHIGYDCKQTEKDERIEVALTMLPIEWKDNMQSEAWVKNIRLIDRLET